jgi:hypothetical protein
MGRFWSTLLFLESFSYLSEVYFRTLVIYSSRCSSTEVRLARLLVLFYQPVLSVTYPSGVVLSSSPFVFALLMRAVMPSLEHNMATGSAKCSEEEGPFGVEGHAFPQLDDKVLQRLGKRPQLRV